MYLSQIGNVAKNWLFFTLAIGIFVITLMTNCEIICHEDSERSKISLNDTVDNSLLDVSVQHLRMWMFMHNKRINRKFEEIKKYNSNKLDGVMHTLFRAVNVEKGDVKTHRSIIRALTKAVSHLNMTIQIARRNNLHNTRVLKRLIAFVKKDSRRRRGNWMI
uniref:Uncharacterized protein n=1 Tax=Strigamia maritima TaxID=126957 RepID=T1IKZ2_STRMM